MKILVTGAEGFLGRNLCAELANIREGLSRFDNVHIDEIFQYDVNHDESELDDFCKRCDFVFHFAGVNRPKQQEEFLSGNVDSLLTLLETLKKHGNRCPVMLSSSQQASLTGRFSNSEYGRSKKMSESALLDYGESEHVPVMVFRFPNVFGKWCRPNYNSAVATFCYNIANDLPIQISDPNIELELLYIDDLVSEMLACLTGNVKRCEFDGLQVLSSPTGRYCYAAVTHKATLGHIVDLLYDFRQNTNVLRIPHIPSGSFEKKLLSTYQSYLPPSAIKKSLKMNVDSRGSFTELLHLADCGQVSINISKPCIVKGQHWHHTKWEYFIVVKGHGLIQERKIGTNEIVQFEVSGDNIEAVAMLPGHTHNIINLSDTEDLVTVMYCNETFDANHPDTYSEPV